MTGYGKGDLMERIAELEERISELARENAELKQVPRHVDEGPRCPLRDGMTGEMGACERDCAWLVSVDNGAKLVCVRVAEAVADYGMHPIRAINYTESEVDE